MSNYCEYYLYQLYIKYGEQDFIPAYPMQLNISGDTGQDPVIKRCQSPNCGYVEPIEPQYRWILSGYTCQGFDKYERYIEQVSNDDGLTWSNTGNEAASGLVETNSSDCGYVGRLTRWINSGTTCYEGDKYVRIVEQVSYDNINWTNTGNISRGYLIETASPDCIQYRWVDIPITTDYICDDCPDPQRRTITAYTCHGYDKYLYTEHQASYDNWSTYIIESTGETLVEIDSEFCGYVEPQYRWAVSTGYVCSGTNKMTKEVYQVSYDSGNTWNNVTPEQSRAALPIIEANSTDCGYAERTVTSYTCHNYDKYLLTEYQISSDSGSTWSTTGSGETLIETDSEYCGFIPPEPQYRTLTTATTCIGYDKYTLSEYQVSYDSGATWTTTGTSATTLIEADSTDCGYVPIDYSGQYFTTVARENGTFSFAKSSANTNTDIQYSLDSGSTWNTLASGSSTPTVTTGNKVYWKGTLNAVDNNSEYMGIGKFSSTGQFDVEGNTMSLLYGDNFVNQTTISDCALANLFSLCTTIINAKNMVLPATTVPYYGYYMMFFYCQNLLTAPELPATTLGNEAYDSMFRSCSNLLSSPELPAATLGIGAYDDYFYQSMFRECSKLKYIKCLATNVDTRYFNNWLYRASSTGTFVKDANTTWPSGTSGIPSGWTIQNA